ncbi:type VII secretion integral membrane protein EccD [Glycomyces sp. TRM65418]|uniref:type VII secretion integral membrane protein EccD n=1 Tax=Glycomyces sp. TRM65418 TaxID=2867006 RepID=UPI001CE6D4E1|nr:type VII secretion integral membrane protein EccD [Glycomyces sp. TRM65418]MCC3761601.1 type VII secretion integral membrane protein EccD [Glycomyces sp. TRM65418]QZD55697.1 type VII secretion integral membrane protein EccD [Glycomyces sp. TRM65418]
MPGQYSTVTVVGPETTRDLALPDDLPVAELLPEMLRHTGGDTDGTAVSWAVSTPEGATFEPSETLRDKTVADGSMLLVHDATAAALPETVEDVRDGVEDAVDETGIRWEPGTGRLVAVATAGLLVAAAAFSPGVDGSILLTGGLVAVLAVLMSWWSTRQHALMTHLALIGGCLWAGRVGFVMTDTFAPDGRAARPTQLLGALLAALLLVIVARAGARLATSYAVGLGIAVALGAGAWTLWAHAGLAPTRVAVLVVLAALFSFALAPRASMFSAGLFTLDREVRGGEPTTDARLRDRLGRTDSRITGAIWGLTATAAAAGALLAAQDAFWAQLMGTGTALALLTRSRIFELVRHVAPLRLAGMAAGAWAAWNWIEPSEPLRQWLPALAVLSGMAYVSVASISRSQVSAAWWRRVVGIAEILLVAGLTALAGELLGLYAAVAGA